MNEIAQGSDAWKQMRLGKLTASRFADAIAQTRSGWGASRANYRAELVAERLTGVPAEHYVNGAMIWGTEQEANARSAYAFLRNADIFEAGFIEHPTINDTGCSPDGLVDIDGLIEIKCPNTATHLDTLLGKPIDGKYIIQMQWQMATTGRRWCDWVSYDPRLPERMQLFVQRVMRDDGQINVLEQQARVFLAEVAQMVDDLTAKYGAAA